jgi:hypothetical protein
VRYALLMYADPAHTQAMSELAVEDVKRKHGALVEELIANDEVTGGAGLALPHETTVLRLDGDSIAVREGPLTPEPVEQLTAYYEIDCETLDRAREIASRILDDHVTAIELRRIHDSVDL